MKRSTRIPSRWQRHLQPDAPRRRRALQRLYPRYRQNVAFWRYRAEWQLQQDLPQQADEAFRRALRRNPEAAQIWQQAALLARGQGHVLQAIQWQLRCLEQTGFVPDSLFYRQLAADCQSGGLDDLALSFYLHALEQGDLSAEVCLALFHLLARRGELQTALDCLQVLSRWHTVSADLLAMMGGLLLAQHGRFEDARQVYQEATAHSHWPAFWQLQAALSSSPIKADTQAWLQDYQTLQFGLNSLTQPLVSPAERPERLFCLTVLHRQIAQFSYTPLALLPLWQAFARLCYYHLPVLPPLPPRPPAPGRRVRLGLVLAPESAVMVYLVLGNLLDALDPERFELQLFVQRHLPAHWQTPDAPHRFQRAMACHVLPESLPDAAEQMRAAALDLVFFSEPGWYFQQYALASLRMAPLQVTQWLNVNTTGLKQIDYFLSAEGLERPGAQQHYSEKLICWPCLPSLPPVAVFPEPPRSRADFGLDPDAPVLLCAQNLLKLHPDFDRVLATALRAVPTAQLALVAAREDWQAEALSQRFAEVMPDVMPRIWIFPPLSNPDFLGLIQIADVGLDSFYYGSGNTAYQMLAWGLPVVTWPGEYLRGRILAVLCEQIGYPEGVVDSPVAYMTRVIALLSQPELRAEIQQRLRSNAARIWEDQRAAVAMQDFLNGLFPPSG